MAPPYTSTSDKPKRVRKRKARTEVSSSDDTSSDSDSSSSSSSSDNQSVHNATLQKPKSRVVVAPKSKSQPEPQPTQTTQRIQGTQTDTDNTAQQSHLAAAEEAFDSFYLRQITNEFAQDLDKIRSAGDFTNKSIATLVNALKQGRSTFTRDERISAGVPLAANHQ